MSIESNEELRVSYSKQGIALGVAARAMKVASEYASEVAIMPTKEALEKANNTLREAMRQMRRVDALLSKGGAV